MDKDATILESHNIPSLLESINPICFLKPTRAALWSEDHAERRWE